MMVVIKLLPAFKSQSDRDRETDEGEKGREIYSLSLLFVLLTGAEPLSETLLE